MNKRKSTKMIILHCAATPEGKDYKVSDIKKWHKQRGFQDIGYHYVVDLDGTLEEGRKEDLVGAHCTGKNAISIGICYVGGIAKDGKTPKDTRTYNQKQALLDIVFLMLQKYHLTINDVYCHNQFANKACPSFKINTFKKEYEEAFGFLDKKK